MELIMQVELTQVPLPHLTNPPKKPLGSFVGWSLFAFIAFLVAVIFAVRTFLCATGRIVAPPWTGPFPFVWSLCGLTLAVIVNLYFVIERWLRALREFRAAMDPMKVLR